MGVGYSKQNLSYQEFIKVMKTRNLALSREFIQMKRRQQRSIGNEAHIFSKTSKFGSQISANFLDGWEQKRRFICTDTPQEQSAYEFWKIILKYGVRIIVMLSDDRVQQSYKYWECDGGEVKIIRNFRIEIVELKYFQNYKVTTLGVNNNATGEFHEVIHFACTSWAHFCTFQGKVDFCYFIHSIRSAYEEITNGLLGEKTPMVVHCISGLNAADVFCAMDISISEYYDCLLYTSPSPRDRSVSRMPSSA